MLATAQKPTGQDTAGFLAQQATQGAKHAAECYCGWYAACPLFRMMSSSEREECTRDKRQDAQRMWKNGMAW